MTPVQGAARLALAGAMLLAAAPAQAQLIRTRPFQGIFRTTQNPADSRDRIDVRAFVAAGHDESSITGWAMKPRGFFRMASRICAISARLALGPTSMP